MGCVKLVQNKISIHAPTRGATTLNLYSGIFTPISIHAPTRGATRCSFLQRPHGLFQSTLPREERRKTVHGLNFIVSDFNPRSHERSDEKRTLWRSVIKISIHAPTRGATTNGATFLLPFLFQSTLPREERPSCFKLSMTGARFQSTLPREERPTCFCTVVVVLIFQSTLPREERLCAVLFFPGSLCISIHAPTRGATSFSGFVP